MRFFVLWILIVGFLFQELSVYTYMDGWDSGWRDRRCELIFLIKTDNNIKNGIIEWVEQSGSRSGDSWNGIPAENLEWNWFGNRRENYFSIKIFSPTFLINNFKFVSLGHNITAAAGSDGTELWHWHTNTTHKKISFSKSIFSRSTFALLLFGFTKSPRTFVTLLFSTFHFTSCTRVSTLFFCFFCHCSRVELAFFCPHFHNISLGTVLCSSAPDSLVERHKIGRNNGTMKKIKGMTENWTQRGEKKNVSSGGRRREGNKWKFECRIYRFLILTRSDNDSWHQWKNCRCCKQNDT